jgi:hypothetical protein
MQKEVRTQTHTLSDPLSSSQHLQTLNWLSLTSLLLLLLLFSVRSLSPPSSQGSGPSLTVVPGQVLFDFCFFICLSLSLSLLLLMLFLTVTLSDSWKTWTSSKRRWRNLSKQTTKNWYEWSHESYSSQR